MLLKNLHHKWKKDFWSQVQSVFKVLNTFKSYTETDFSVKTFFPEPRFAPLSSWWAFLSWLSFSENGAGSTRSNRSCIFKLWVTSVVYNWFKTLTGYGSQLFFKSSVVLVRLLSQSRRVLAPIFGPWCSLFITHYGSPELSFTIAIYTQAVFQVTAPE